MTTEVEQEVPAVQAVPELAPIDRPDVSSGELPIGLRALIDAGVHFGHQTKRWNPKMRPYIYGARNGIHIVDLDQTAVLFRRAFEFVTQAVGRGGHILFVGTKRQASDVVLEEAVRAGQYYVTGRWLGGTLTNFTTVKKGIDRLRELDRQEADGTLELLTKKEALGLRRERERLEKFLGGIKHMDGLPSALFIIESQMNYIMDAMASVEQQGCRSVEVTTEAEAQYTEMVHREMEGTVWESGGCNSWYKSKSGKVIAMFPGFSFTFRHLARRMNPAHHRLAA